jgi:tetratricopeptide (TPR) repeat protein
MGLVVMDSLDSAQQTIDRLRDVEARGGGYTVFLAPLLEAEIKIARGDAAGALEILRERRQRGVLNGMMYIYFYEIVADAHAANGNLADAIAVHRDILSKYQGHALSHYALGKLYEKMNRLDDAAREYAVFLEMWSEADEGLPQVEDAESRLAVLAAGSR